MNVRKHSGAQEAQVELVRGDEQLELCISDPGRGFDPTVATEGHGLGLISMRERLRLIGGTLGIESGRSRGTRVRARVPLSRAEQVEHDIKKHAANA